MSSPANSAPQLSNLKATAILDIEHETVQKLAERFLQSDSSGQALLQKVHIHLSRTLRPVYSVDEWQPASRTIQRGRGSCSQRMACLEAIARTCRVPTRVRALHVKGSFWYPRFQFSRWFIPGRILLLWPQFHIEGSWLDFDELHLPLADMVANGQAGFTNDAESLFEAVRNKPIDFTGKTCGLTCAKPEHDLSMFILNDEGFFDTRDEAFERFGSFGQTLRGRVFEMVFGDRKST
jgi:hypothetical protein